MFDVLSANVSVVFVLRIVCMSCRSFAWNWFLVFRNFSDLTISNMSASNGTRSLICGGQLRVFNPYVSGTCLLSLLLSESFLVVSKKCAFHLIRLITSLTFSISCSWKVRSEGVGMFLE